MKTSSLVQFHQRSEIITMSDPGFPSFGTDAIHAGQDPAKFNFKSAVPPITMASTYQRSDTGIPDLTNGKYIYSR